MTTIYDVRDYGATADDLSDDSAAIQAAIDAAYEAGGGTVWIPSGLYYVSGDPTNSSAGAVEVRTNVTLTGDGPGNTILKLVDGFDERINGIVRTSAKEDASNVVISNLTIDGNRDNNLGFQTGVITGVKESSDGRIHTDITISNVEVMNANGYGINPHEITYNLIVENSISHNNGVDGFVADNIINGIYRDNLAYENDRHGLNVTTSSNGILLEDNEAYSNGGAGVIVQRGDIFPDGQNDIDWPMNVEIRGGALYDNGREGIFLKMADLVTISDVSIYGNERQGIRVDGATNTTIDGNKIYNNSQAGDEAYDEIQIRGRFDIYTGNTYYATNTVITNNTIFSDSPVSARYGIREEAANTDGGPTGTFLLSNVIYGLSRGELSVPGYDSNPQGDPPPTDFAPIFVGTTQAETLDLTTFQIEAISAAEGDLAISSRTKNQEAVAKGSFVGEDGTYTISVAYFDENDGAAVFGVRVNGVEVHSWVADQDFGVAGASKVNRVSEDVQLSLNQFDVIEVFATRDGNELVRVDSISIIAVNTPPDLDEPMVAVSDFFDALEDSVLTVGAANGLLWNDRAEDGGAAVAAGTIVTEEGGIVEVAADGSFTYTPPVDFFGTDTFIYSVADADGDEDTALVGLFVEDQPEFALVAEGRTQAEDLSLETFSVEGVKAADGGLVIASRTKGVEATAKGSFAGEDGTYLMTIGYFDENDGASEMGLRIDGVLVDSWIADLELGQAGANAANFVTRTVTVDLELFDTIELFATRDGGELVRIDYFDLEAVTAIV